VTEPETFIEKRWHMASPTAWKAAHRSMGARQLSRGGEPVTFDAPVFFAIRRAEIARACSDDFYRSADETNLLSAWRIRFIDGAVGVYSSSHHAHGPEAR